MYHLVFYRIKVLLGDKSIVFWSLMFPLILGTLFRLTFGDGGDVLDNFNKIPVAVVISEETQESTIFLSQMKTITSGESALFDIKEVSLDTANTLLKDNEIKGIITYADSFTLIVSDNGIEETIIKSFLDQYRHTEQMLREMNFTSTKEMIAAIEQLSNNQEYLNEISLGGEKISCNLQYYYALIAMTCIYGCFIGLKNCNDIQANLSALAARRCVTPTNKLKLILSDMIASQAIHFSIIVLVVCYLRFILHVNVAINPPFFFLSCFIGSLIGVCLGQFLGALLRFSYGIKVTISVAISMLLSFFSGLMFNNIKDIVEKNIPIINRLNPNTLLTDMFYSLTIYSDYSRFIKNLIILTLMAAFFTIGSFVVTWREKYASL